MTDQPTPTEAELAACRPLFKALDDANLAGEMAISACGPMMRDLRAAAARPVPPTDTIAAVLAVHTTAGWDGTSKICSCGRIGVTYPQHQAERVAAALTTEEPT